MADSEQPATEAESNKNNDILIAMHKEHTVQQSAEITTVSALTIRNSGQYSVDQIIEHLEECTDGGAHLDIYQIVAWRCKNNNHGISYYQLIFKAILAACSQILGMVVVLSQEIDQGIVDKTSYCPHNEPVHFRIMALLFCFIILVFAFDALGVAGHYGMHRVNHIDFSNLPDFINPYWLIIGQYINTFVMLMVLYGSFFLVYFSQFAADIVLNAVAMFFMLELDDLLINEQDYKDLNRFLKTYKHKNDYKISTCFLWSNRIVYYPTAAFVIVSLFAAVFLSFFIAWCH